MLYRDFKGKKISALGMGCMRFPTVTEDEKKQIDKTATKELISYAIGHGINYFDTAWPYHDGMSEPVMGELLADYPRDSFYLATKFPGYDSSFLSRVEEIFESQLTRCKTDYFDFYLCHNVNEKNINGYFNRDFGIVEYLKKQKENGRIHHLGFSTHGSLYTIKRFLDAYGKDMEFCQLQINWLDWTFQKAREKVALVASYGIPVWVMEPVRGGRIATIAPDQELRLRRLRPDTSVPEWAFRFVQSIPEVTVTLSGMSNLDQLKENIKTYTTEKPLNALEKATLFEIADEIITTTAVPCTTCNYCTAHCPMALPIPELIKRYNKHAYESKIIPPSALEGIETNKRPDGCIGCRSCEELCPQGIKISEILHHFSDRVKD